MKKILTILTLMTFLAQNAFCAVIFKTGNYYGLSDENNNIILSAEYQQIEQLEYTPSKTILIPMQATDDVKVVKSNFYKIKKNGKFGIANDNGKVIHECKYDNVKLNEYGEVVLVSNNTETLANPVKNKMKATGKTVESIIGLPVTIVAGVMIPIEVISKMGKK